MSSSTGAGHAAESPESYEEIERAVMETARGRWFLAEYARRQRAGDLGAILEAIQRLERAMAAKAAPPVEDGVASRITRAIETIGQVQQELGGSAPPEHLDARQLRYFRKDEEIFSGEAVARPVAVPSPEPSQAAEPKGARLVIRRREAPEAPAVPEETASAPAAAAAAPPSLPAAEAPPKRRIVIIRHKAGEEIDVPLQSEFGATG
jgi:hypothetical protein